MYSKNVGVDIGGTKMHMLAIYNGEYIEKTVKTGMDVSKEFLRDELEKFINDLPFEVEAIGMALPGLVKNNNYLIISDVVPSLNGVNSDFFSFDKYTVKFINDVKAATLTESFNYTETNTVAVLMVGTGIALGVYANNRIFGGSNGFAGEVGYAHTTVDGKLMKFDDLASGRAILEKAGVSALELIDQINSKDEDAIKIVKDAGKYFGLLLGLVIQFYNPGVIVVGGGVKRYPHFMEEALKVVRNATLKESFDNTIIVDPVDSKNIVAKWALLYDVKMY